MNESRAASRLEALLRGIENDTRPDRKIYRDLTRAIRPFGRHNGILNAIEKVGDSGVKRRAAEREAWHLAVSLRLPIARLPWPPSPDEKGNLSLREHELLFWHLMETSDPWSLITPSALKDLPGWPANPLLCALWRFVTNKDLDSLTEPHRTALTLAHDTVGLAWLVIEEARHRAQHEQDAGPFLLIDKQIMKRFTMRPDGRLLMIRFTSYYADFLRSIGKHELADSTVAKIGLDNARMRQPY